MTRASTPKKTHQEDTLHLSHEKYHRFLTLTSFVTLLLVIGNYFFSYYIITQNEYNKVGGKENYEIVKKVQQMQILPIVEYYKKNPDALKQQSAPATSSTPNPDAPTYISTTEIPKIIENIPFLGSQDAPVAWLEFSDLECPYCKQLQESGIYEALDEKFPGKIQYFFKHYPLSIHPGSEKKHQLAECVYQQLGSEGYFNFLHEVYKSNDFSFSISYNKSLDIAVALGGNNESLDNCVEGGELAGNVTTSSQQGQSYFSISGTPTTVLLNKNTGQYKIISGISNISDFENALTSLFQ